ncbi:Extracellular ligand-binding receptor [Beggiatoa sp. PS]|nr:Extracellular ligand-binding receptor [Beggiatoa sp. PS]
MKLKIRFSIVLIIISLIGACLSDESSKEKRGSKEKREQWARKNKEEIVIGVAWSLTHPLLKGVDLATKEINNRGGVNIADHEPPRTIRIEKIDSSITAKTSPLQQRISARNIARKFASMLEVVAVIGHRYSSIAIPASITYQYNGIIFLAPSSTNLMLTSHDFDYVFRMLPNNEEMAKQLAAYCKYYQRYQKMIVLNDRGDYGEELADSFINSAVEYGIKIKYRRTFFVQRSDFANLIADLKNRTSDVNAIFIATSANTGGQIIKQSRRMELLGIDEKGEEIKMPFIGGDSLANAEELWKVAKNTAEGLVVPTVYNEELKIVQQFKKHFKEEYREFSDLEPDQSVALGYDAVKLLVYAMDKADSIVPIEVATQLHYMSNGWKGVTGIHKYQQTGELDGKQLYFMRLTEDCDTGKCKGKFKLIPEAHLPYLYIQQHPEFGKDKKNK